MKEFNFLKVFIVPALIIFSGTAFAQKGGGLFIEPGVTYENSSGEINWPSPLNDSTSELRGFGASARLGFHLNDSLFIAADGRYSKPRFETSASSSTVDAEAFNYGPVLGLQMPFVGLRIWGTYILGAELDPEAYDSGGANLDGKFKEGEGYRVGAGFKIFALSLNVEYQKLTYDKTELEELGPFSSGTVFDTVELEDESWILGISFPFAF